MSITTEIQRLQTAKADIKSAIEEKGVIVGDGLIDTYADKVREISGGSGVNLGDLCSRIRFESLNVFGTPEVTINLPKGYTFESMFQMPSSQANVNTTVEHLTVSCPNRINSCQYMFGTASGNVYDPTLKRLTLNVDTSKSVSFYNAFKHLDVVEIIDGTPLDFSSLGANTTQSAVGAFEFCNALREVRFVENTMNRNLSFVQSSKLTDETIQSIIGCLADRTDKTTLTLALHATVGAKLTEEQKATITAKNWTLAY